MGNPAKSDDFVGRGGATERADFGGSAAKEAKAKFRHKSQQEQTAASKLRMEKRGEKLEKAKEKLAKQKPPKPPGPVRRVAGTVGGGVFMNAGAYGGEMKQIVESVTVLTMGGEEKMLSGEECAFGYRTSVYQKLPCVIVKAVLQLHPGDPEEIGQTMRTLMEKRRASQPLDLPSAGSTFKRPTGYFAGPLIEQAGLKGCGVGGAEVSKKHAGFVVNTGGASADDVKKTIAMVQSRVWETSGVRLEPEVRIW